jgi:hypothetical protein
VFFFTYVAWLGSQQTLPSEVCSSDSRLARRLPPIITLITLITRPPSLVLSTATHTFTAPKGGQPKKSGGEGRREGILRQNGKMKSDFPTEPGHTHKTAHLGPERS